MLQEETLPENMHHQSDGQLHDVQKPLASVRPAMWLACLFHHRMAANRPAVDRVSLQAAVRCNLLASENDSNHTMRVLRISHGNSGVAMLFRKKIDQKEFSDCFKDATSTSLLFERGYYRDDEGRRNINRLNYVISIINFITFDTLYYKKWRTGKESAQFFTINGVRTISYEYEMDPEDVQEAIEAISNRFWIPRYKEFDTSWLRTADGVEKFHMDVFWDFVNSEDGDDLDEDEIEFLERVNQSNIVHIGHFLEYNYKINEFF
jgi:hypothetical protein